MRKNMRNNKKTTEKLHFSAPLLLIPIVVAVLAYLSYDQMLWRMTLYAPMYPKGLVMQAFGTKILGDLNEINLLNHYVGMHPITADSITLMWLYPVGVASLVLAGIAAAFLPNMRKWIAVGVMTIPVSMLVTIQYYLYYFGHNLNPDAPIDLPPFTPLVLGKSTIVVFHSFSIPGPAMAFYLAAALLIWFSPRMLSKLSVHGKTSRLKNMTGAKSHAFPAVLLIALLLASSAHATQLQDRISAARSGDTIRLTKGTIAGPIVIDRPLTLISDQGAIIEGNRSGSVIAVRSDNVTIEGLTVRRSGFEIHEDAAGISISGDNVTVKGNRIEDVYFGIHATDCGRIFILGNDIEPGLEYTSRPGHAINVWNVKSAEIRNNKMRNARDGILLTYVEKVDVQNNYVTLCRYGLHSMYSKDIVFSNNTLEDNLLGIALMYSKKMLAKGNVIQRHRRGSSPYGFLLKDLDNLVMEDNRIIGNQIGIFADAVSLENNSSSVVRNNLIAGNEVAFSMQSNVRLSFYNNSVIDNLVDFEKQGIRFNSECQWTNNGKGNYWSNYRGFDGNSDGVGELTYSVEDITEHVIDRSTAARAFLYTPSHLMLESAIRMFPIFRPAPLLKDQYPITNLPANAQASFSSTPTEQSLAIALLLMWIIGIAKLRGWSPLLRTQLLTSTKLR
jgi:nitrous oxidase accessory protein